MSYDNVSVSAPWIVHVYVGTIAATENVSLMRSTVH